SPEDDERQNLLNDPAQKALERFDETLRELALLRYLEFERELEPVLTRFAIPDTIRRIQEGGRVHWPDAQGEAGHVERLTAKLNPKFGHWLARIPALEDVSELAQEVARDLHEEGIIDDVASALQIQGSVATQTIRRFVEALGGRHETFSSELLHAVTDRRS